MQEKAWHPQGSSVLPSPVLDKTSTNENACAFTPPAHLLQDSFLFVCFLHVAITCRLSLSPTCPPPGSYLPCSFCPQLLWERPMMTSKMPACLVILLNSTEALLLSLLLLIPCSILWSTLFHASTSPIEAVPSMQRRDATATTQVSIQPRGSFGPSDRHAENLLPWAVPHHDLPRST